MIGAGCASHPRTVERLAPQELEPPDPGVLEVGVKGRELPASAYVTAIESRVHLPAAVDQVLSRLDVLITPTVPVVAFAAGADVPVGWPDERWMSWNPFTFPFTLTGHPALTVPCGLSGRGMPIGVQLVGRKFEDGLLLVIGTHAEAALELPSPPIPSGTAHKSEWRGSATSATHGAGSSKPQPRGRPFRIREFESSRVRVSESALPNSALQAA